MTPLERLPTREEFDQALLAFVKPLEDALIADCTRRIAYGQDEELRRAAATTLLYEQWKAHQAAFDIESVQLVLGDPAIVSAWNSASRSVKWISGASAIERATQSLLDTKIVSLDYPADWIEPTIRQTLDERTALKTKWCVMTMAALREYFHDEGAVSRMNAARNRLDELQSAVRSGASAIREITQMVIDENASPTVLSDDAAEEAEGRIVRSLHLKMAQLNKTLPPTIRQGETARERLLMYRMCVAHGGLFRSQKPTAVYELLHARGVRTLDRRNVDRACQSFATRTKTRGPSEYRRLIEQIRQTSAGAARR
ncbi:hypothetical protein [Achromobacter denitrificans]|uniref:Uncharacterized protein n=1 Tax=Achromobacter denitrificans TaxID=32002 RepID=A0A6N0JN83_ACHDE|nr:hypothetical protein [Achromobacter denitrificans]QKQ48514.1 hypothetical protein FOC81_18165 [Achromobacter denitrificans]